MTKGGEGGKGRGFGWCHSQETKDKISNSHLGKHTIGQPKSAETRRKISTANKEAMKGNTNALGHRFPRESNPNAMKTQCANGHDFTAQNTRVLRRKRAIERICVLCHNERNKEYRRKLKLK
jgi:hypothetical protein